MDHLGLLLAGAGMAIIPSGVVAGLFAWLRAPRFAMATFGFGLASALGLSVWVGGELSRPIEGDVPGIVFAPLIPAAPSMLMLLNAPALVALQRRTPVFALGLVTIGGVIGWSLWAMAATTIAGWLALPVLGALWAISLGLALTQKRNTTARAVQ